MGYMTDGLTLNTLRSANLARLPEFRDRQGRVCHKLVEGQPVGFDWSLSQWANAELGEAANLIKKIERGDFTLEEQRDELGKPRGTPKSGQSGTAENRPVTGIRSGR